MKIKKKERMPIGGMVEPCADNFQLTQYNSPKDNEDGIKQSNAAFRYNPDVCSDLFWRKNGVFSNKR